jgi:hypothetical protein
MRPVGICALWIVFENDRTQLRSVSGHLSYAFGRHLMHEGLKLNHWDLAVEVRREVTRGQLWMTSRWGLRLVMIHLGVRSGRESREEGPTALSWLAPYLSVLASLGLIFSAL